MPGPVALSLHDVRVRYGAAVALDGVSLDVRRGEIVGLLGPNGSGKSTTLAVAAGVIDTEMGRASIEGSDYQSAPAEYARRVGLVPQAHALYDELSAADNLRFFGRLYGLSGRDLARRVRRSLADAQLIDRADDRIDTFSGGMRQRVSLAVALLHEPTVLLLDEPTAALDPQSRALLFARLARLRDEGHAILLTTHHLDEAEHGCDRVVVLDRGRVVSAGKPGDLLRIRVAGKAVLYGHLRDPLPKFRERALRQRLGPALEMEVTGRRLRLASVCSEDLGRGLAHPFGGGHRTGALPHPAGHIGKGCASRADLVRHMCDE